MADQWYCQLDGTSVGPIDAGQLQGLVRRGRVTPETLVRTATSKNWMPAGKVAGLKFTAPAVATSSPPSAPAPAKNPVTAQSSATMRAPATLKKAKLLEPGVSPGQVQRSADSNSFAGIVPPPPVAPPVYGAAPYPPPPPPGFDPAAIPTGLPVGIPMGSVVPVTGPEPAAPAAGASPWINVSAAPPAVSRARSPEGLPGPGDKKQKARQKLYWMVGAVGGVLLALVVVGVVLSLGSKPDGTKEQQVARKGLDEELAEASQRSDSVPKTAAAAGNEGDKTVEAAASKENAGKDAPAGAKGGGPKGSERSASGPSELASAIKSVSKWFDMSAAAAVTSKTMKLQLTSAWLEGGTESSTDQDEPNSTTSAGATPRLFIELRITNTQPDSPLNYSSWNGDGGKNSRSQALLATDSGAACSLVPVSKTKGVARQSVPVKLKAGQTITELLVFAAPDGDFEMLQLMLPTSAVGQAGRYLGLKIPRERVAAQKPVELADQPEPTTTAGTSARQAPAPGENAKIIANAEPMPPTPPKPREETIDDLRKSIVDSVKDKQKEKDEEVAKMREANKKKPD